MEGDLLEDLVEEDEDLEVLDANNEFNSSRWGLTERAQDLPEIIYQSAFQHLLDCLIIMNVVESSCLSEVKLNDLRTMSRHND